MKIWMMVSIGLMAGLFAHLAIAEEDPILGKAGDYVVKKSDLERVLSYYPPQSQKTIQSNPRQRINIVKWMLQAKAIADRAKKEDLDKRPDVKKRLEYILDDFLAREYLKKVVIQGIQVTEEEMKKFYTKNENRYVTPEQVRARHILIKVPSGTSEEEKKKLREKAEGLLKRIKSGEDFAKLAEEFSEEPASKKRGGDVWYFPRARMAKPFEDVAFSLKPGQLNEEVVETQFGFHIIKVEEHKEGKSRSFDEVKDSIRSQLQDDLGRTKAEDFLNQVFKEAGMEIYPEKTAGDKKEPAAK